ncbi:MAG: hypothetical protein HC896_06665 [Bacteroidales bacterium]|nr:hypothetical protein [Bacteroidales bacterium]
MKKSSIFYQYTKLFNEEIQVSYKGPFDSKVLALLGDYINVILGKDPEASRKIFKIFMELAQNISFYSAEITKLIDARNVGVGSLLIREKDDSYYFHVGNTVNTDDIIPIIEKCEYINTLDRDSLRHYKREQRNLPRGVKGGAHIGLIQVALTSTKPIDFEVVPIDNDYSFFSIMVEIEKN